jgi:hypothetical protein
MRCTGVWSFKIKVLEQDCCKKKGHMICEDKKGTCLDVAENFWCERTFLLTADTIALKHIFSG